jgi:hypothetical protein
MGGHRDLVTGDRIELTGQPGLSPVIPFCCCDNGDATAISGDVALSTSAAVPGHEVVYGSLGRKWLYSVKNAVKQTTTPYSQIHPNNKIVG